MSRSKQPKITIIKPFRHAVQMDPNYAEKTWTLLRDSIRQIHKQNASGLSFEELYRNAYNMVLHKYGEYLYKGLERTVREHLDECAKKVNSANDEEFAQQLQTTWQDHKTSQLRIRDILMYMDRVYVVHQNVPHVYDLGLNVFRDAVARQALIKPRLRDLMLSTIQRERLGEVVNRGVLKQMTSMLVDVGVNSKKVYESDFEAPFLQASKAFFADEASQFIASNGCANYLRKAESRLEEEMSRAQHYLDESTAPKLRALAERELLAVHMETLMSMPNSGFLHQVEEKKHEDLHRMFKLFARVPEGHNMMRKMLYSYLLERGNAIVKDPELQKAQNTYVGALLELKDRCQALLLEAFDKDKLFQQVINKAFETFVNSNEKSPEYISLFIDNKLKKGLKGLTEAEVEDVLEKVLVLFRYLTEKDMFEKYYKQHLARRLLLGRSVSDDAERNMIGMLRKECGYQFTQKLEGMFKDMALSVDTMADFHAMVKDKEINTGNVDLSVHVLTTGFWPTSANVGGALPPAVMPVAEAFKKYYLDSHSGRRLTWQTNLGTAELRAYFGSKRHELNVSTYQMIILLLFNDRDEYSCADIAQLSGIPLVSLKRNLQSLSLGKYKVLLKNSTERVVSDQDVFSFNTKFRSKLFRLRIGAAGGGKETAPETERTRAKVFDDRRHQIEAAIVRVMKSRKEMSHTNLIMQVTEQLATRFTPNPMLIKKRIEGLIEREYLERDKVDRKRYRYLA